MRRDHADVFCTTEEGVKGKRAVEWRLVDDVVPGSKFEDAVAARAKEFAAKSHRNGAASGIKLTPLSRNFTTDSVDYSALSVELPAPADRNDHLARAHCVAARFGRRHGGAGRGIWPLKLARELDDAILHIRINEFDVAAIVFKSSGDPAPVLAYDAVPRRQSGALAGARNPAVLEARAQARRSDLAFAGDADRAGLVLCRNACRIAVGVRPHLHAHRGCAAATTSRRPRLRFSDVNFGACPMSNGLTRLACRFLANPADVDTAKARGGQDARRRGPHNFGLITFALDDIDWDDEVRVFLEERASFSPDALTGLEANLRFAGPETMESKIFARLTAWQNWIFQRPNAIGDEGALKRYGTGQKPVFDTRRV